MTPSEREAGTAQPRVIGPGEQILPGAEGEAAHNDALAKSIDQVLRGDPVDVSDAIPAGSDFESRIGDLPSEYGTTAPVAEGEPAEAAPSFRPGSLTADQIHEQLAAPEAANAMRADVERAIDEAAQKGEVLKVPLAVTENGDPIRFAPSSVFEPAAETPLWGAEGMYSGVGAPNYSTGGGIFSAMFDEGRPLPAIDFFSVADQLAEVDRMNELASQILACATPGAMAAE